jgi:RNA polymerase sigma factor (sigma-70 family)
MFPTTIWTTIRNAGQKEPEALAAFAESYRAPVLRYIRRRGFDEQEAQDVCQDVFLRVFKGDVLARADRARGKFRSLLLSVTIHTLQDRLRKKKLPVVEDPEAVSPVPRPDDEEEFDRAWMMHLSEKAMARLRVDSPGYHEVLKDHLAGKKPHRNKLWIARTRLISFIRAEIAATCSSHAEYEEEVTHLERFLRPGKRKNGEEPEPR